MLWLDKGNLFRRRTIDSKDENQLQNKPITEPTDNVAQTQSGDFEVSLLILASIVIKADGKQDQRELDFVRQQFVNMYGKERANHAFKLFKNISKQNIFLHDKFVCKSNK